MGDFLFEKGKIYRIKYQGGNWGECERDKREKKQIEKGVRVPPKPEIKSERERECGKLDCHNVGSI